jgi:8-oxo-dGTP pyrophosphatase MutT (NUDIX family)
MTVRPDLVDVWIFRVVGDQPQILMLHRAPGRILPGLWQGVSGKLEDGERIVEAALREVREETGITGAAIESLYSLDFVASFPWDPIDAVMTSVYFALRVRPDVEPVLSHEHDAHRWLSIDAALAASVWPAYREGVGRIRDCILDPDRAPWFELPFGAGAVH